MKGRKLGLWSGMGMVIANMVGAGVFVSSGAMVDSLNPGQILAAWIVGTLIALAGARAYSGIVRLVPRSGGEYRFLSTLVHPVLGYLAGWASLLIGFSAPIAISATAAGAFAGTLYPGLSATLVATLMILALTTVHAVGIRSSVAVQNTLVAAKILLVAGFIVVGLVGGNNTWPEWTLFAHQADVAGGNIGEDAAGAGGFPIHAFMRGLFYIAFTFSGWNAAIYAASEFKNPRRDVPRAMMLGCLVVGILYLCINWVFVANIDPLEQSRIAAAYYEESARITLGHRIMENILGEAGAACMSVLAIIAFISSASAMTFLGPRVYATMARDGFLPAGLRSEEGKPPVSAVLLQGAITLFLVFAYNLTDVLANVGAILTLFSALTVFSLFWICFKRKEYQRPALSVLLAAAVYLMTSVIMLYFGLSGSLTLYLWVGACIPAALGGYFVARRKFSSGNEFPQHAK
ncbi:MAG: amino acid permease [Desulfovibrio sp.]|jgi:APA family basic amino acid/polyamine antiporter|nr:amino acid permease [Desulfovibrio sp.]